MKKTVPRYIENKFLDNPENFNEEFIMKSIREQLNKTLENHLKNCPPERSKMIYSDGKEEVDYTFYTGSGGNIYAFWRYYLLCKNSLINEEKDKSRNLLLQYYSENFNLLENDLKKNTKFDIPSFFLGPVGLLTMGCLIAKEMNLKTEFNNNLQGILNFKKICFDKRCEYELLYGMAGYLYSLLLVKTECRKTFEFNIDDQIYEIFRLIFDCGVNEKKKNKFKYLLFPWSKGYKNNPTVYLGAVHGMFGIIYLLLKTILIIPETLAKEKDLNEINAEILNTVQFIIKQQFDDGNFPACLGEQSNYLVHFCHGAPGSIYTLSLAYQYFKDKSILRSLLLAGELIWQKGIVRKGNLICHGIIGNGIVLYELYKITQDYKWKIRFFNFALATFDKEIQSICKDTEDQGRIMKGIPDSPYSLMEGQSGLIVFYSDILNDSVRFPGFEIYH